MAVVAVMVAGLSIGVGLLSTGGGAPAGTPSPTGSVVSAADPAQITWSNLGPTLPVPSAPGHGPFEQADGLASGFSHDALGAVLAAVNIGTRLGSAAGPAIYEATALRQCVGDVAATLTSIQGQRTSSTPGSATPREMLYRIVDGEATGDHVTVDVAVRSDQSAASGTFTARQFTLHWLDGDWRLQVPLTSARPLDSVSDYTSLGEVSDVS